MTAKKIFGGEDALALAEGRKLYEQNKNRISVLKANEAVDMVDILKAGRAFEMNRQVKLEEKRKLRLGGEGRMDSDNSKEDSRSINKCKDRKKHKGIHCHPLNHTTDDGGCDDNYSTDSVNSKGKLGSQQRRKNKLEAPKDTLAPTRTIKGKTLSNKADDDSFKILSFELDP
mmetsp:Transcript_17553/g.36060  ORF Transcript_17553/g.36060 Transcript_17553/m.36060 type:complete len:172 (-) Transcript_17553:794-1309(-)